MPFHTPPEVLLRQCVRSGKNMTSQIIASSSCSGNQVRNYRAAVVKQLGQPMVVESLPAPKSLKAKEVLISTHAIGLNFADILQWKGQYQIKKELPFVPGAEISGKVIDVGENVKSYKPGDRVVAIGVNGGFAEMCVADSQLVFPVPDHLSLMEAAGALICYSTAMMGFTRKAGLREGESVLVTAAAGATGLAAVDIAKNLFNCKVIGVCGGQDKCQFLRDRGVDHTVDYRTEKIRDRVKEITSGKGVDVAVDQVGGETLLDCVKSLGFEGRALTVGYASGSIPKIPANLMLLKSSSLIGVFWGSYVQANPSAFRESITSVIQGLNEGKLKPYVGTTFSLDQINEAFEHILNRKNIGKTVIAVREENTPPGV
ncbi:hypothetical protein RRG08_032407 [Elysia crispata]|uniref:Enoyl reductase (ER) domain-containing protein n=1 Tax=Elysia crispata TaxID=231223 RepID=A0AAE0XPJ5_9GAST|nr:hypothetical protein RRG08_032407 [Elysia crispata]